MSNPANIQPLPRQFLPNVGLDVAHWEQNLLLEIKQRLEAIVIDPDVPGRPDNFTVSLARGGILLGWTPAPKITGYRIYRNTLNDFDTATIIQEITGLANMSYHDNSMEIPGTFYYWLQGVNASWVGGPISDAATIAIEAAVNTSNSGVYLPVASDLSNLDSVVPSNALWSQVGTVVTVSGAFVAKPTGSATDTHFTMTLPVASNMAVAADLNGTAVEPSVNDSAVVTAAFGSDQAMVDWLATLTTTQNWTYIYQYQVL